MLTYLLAWVGVSVLDFVDHDDVGQIFVSIWTAVEIRLPELYTWPTRLGVGLAES